MLLLRHPGRDYGPLLRPATALFVLSIAYIYCIHHQNNKRKQKHSIGIPSLEFSLVSQTATTHARVRQRRDGDDDDGSREAPSMSLDVHLHPVVNVRRCEVPI